MRTYSDFAGNLLIAEVTPEDHDAIVQLLEETDPAAAIGFVDADEPRPLLSRDDVDRLQAAANRVTIAVVVLVLVITLIQLGRFVGVGS